MIIVAGIIAYGMPASAPDPVAYGIVFGFGLCAVLEVAWVVFKGVCAFCAKGVALIRDPIANRSNVAFVSSRNFRAVNVSSKGSGQTLTGNVCLTEHIFS